MIIPRLLRSVADTRAFGQEIADELRAGDIVALCGALGAGKTHLSQGVVAGLRCDAPVTSPTFTLVHEYRGGRLPVHHLDFYRIESPSELLELGWDELLETDGILIVEWADRFPGLIPHGALWLHLKIEGEARRVESGLPESEE